MIYVLLLSMSPESYELRDMSKKDRSSDYIESSTYIGASRLTLLLYLICVTSVMAAALVAVYLF